MKKQPTENSIERVLNGEATQEEAVWVAEWFGSDEGQVYLSTKMGEDIELIKDSFEELSKGYEIPTEEILRQIERKIRKQHMRRMLYRAAVVIIPLLLVIGAYYQLNSRVGGLFGEVEYVDMYVPKGERILVVFQDGSKVHLNSDTKLRYPKQFGLRTREISLEGEGYFEITENPNRPFIVQLDKASIKVLGTSFNVESYAEDKEIRVNLDKGKIDFIPWTEGHNYLKENEIIVLDKESGLCSITQMKHAEQKSAWKSDVIVFNQESLNNVIKKLNRWYNVEFEVLDEKAYLYSYTLASPNTLIDYILQDLEKVSPVQFTLRDKKVYVKMKEK